jgi:hypothetical protein
VWVFPTRNFAGCLRKAQHQFFRHAASAALKGTQDSIKEAAFFFHLRGFIEGTAVRQDAIVQTNEENCAEFKSFGGVQCEQGGRVGVGDGILVGDERNIFEELIQRAVENSSARRMNRAHFPNVRCFRIHLQDVPVIYIF